jgi:hypothetical protein
LTFFKAGSFKTPLPGGFIQNAFLFSSFGPYSTSSGTRCPCSFQGKERGRKRKCKCKSKRVGPQYVFFCATPFFLTFEFESLLCLFVPLEFAEVLEQLESAFYLQALQKFKDADFVSAGFSSSQIPIEQFTNIQADEAAHATALQVPLSAIYI